MTEAELPAGTSPDLFTPYVAAGKRIPVVLLTHDRAAYLKRTLQALLRVRGVRKQDILISQHGGDTAVASVAQELGIAIEQNMDGLRLRGGRPLDGAQRIAKHYRHSLKLALETKWPQAPGVLVVEDDFLFSPDYYEYFHALGPALDADPSIWLASAWNDNGNAGRVRDPWRLMRTSYFPGLGWLLPRRTWTELAPKWPESHWDHWLRSPTQHRGRHIVYPQVARDYHMGVKGTFMDMRTHDRYFRRVAMQWAGDLSWFSAQGTASIAAVQATPYEARLQAMLATAPLIESVSQLNQLKDGAAVLVHHSPDEPNTPFHGIAEYCGIWHEPARAARAGVHELPWGDSGTLLLVNTWMPRQGYGDLAPATWHPPSTAQPLNAAFVGKGAGPPARADPALRTYSPLDDDAVLQAVQGGDFSTIGTRPWDTSARAGPVQ